MTKTARRLTKILSMLPWVIANPGTSVTEVCHRFGYTEEELIQDLDLVFVCGLPGYGPGDLMVAYVDDDEVVVDMADYFDRPLRLNPAEALGLLASGMAVASTGSAPPALERAIAKLAGILLPDNPEALAVELPADPELVSPLRRAVVEQLVVSFTYSSLSKGDTSSRSVEPWAVFSSLGNWYLSAYCRTAQGERVFRVDRIRDIAVTDERFSDRPSNPPTSVRYHPSDDDVRSVIRLKPQARWVAEYYPVEILEDSDDLTIRFSTSDASVAARLLLRLGPAAELVDGSETQEAVDDLRERLLHRYGLSE